MIRICKSFCFDILTKITISPNNQHFKYIDEDHQIILKEDSLFFANRKITKVNASGWSI